MFISSDWKRTFSSMTVCISHWKQSLRAVSWRDSLMCRVLLFFQADRVSLLLKRPDRQLESSFAAFAGRVSATLYWFIIFFFLLLILDRRMEHGSLSLIALTHAVARRRLRVKSQQVRDGSTAPSSPLCWETLLYCPTALYSTLTRTIQSFSHPSNICHLKMLLGLMYWSDIQGSFEAESVSFLSLIGWVSVWCRVGTSDWVCRLCTEHASLWQGLQCRAALLAHTICLPLM